MDEKDELMVRPFTATLADVGWNIVLMALAWTHEEIGADCPHASTVRKQIVDQLKAQGKEFAK